MPERLKSSLLIGSILLPILLAGWFLAEIPHTSSGERLQALGSLVGAIVGSLGAFGAAWYMVTSERKSSSEPEVVAYLSPHEHHLNLINLVIANIGRGPAVDISIDVDVDVSQLMARDATMPTRRAPIISILPQNEKWVHLFGSALRLLEYPPVPDFQIIVSYKSKTEEPKSSRFRASLSDFEGLRRISSTPETEMAGAQKEIAKTLATLVNRAQPTLRFPSAPKLHDR